MNAEIILVTGDEEGRVVPLEGATVTLGRTRQNTVAVPDKTVSRQHARIVFRNGRHVVVDLNSTHGTTVNGQRVSRHDLKDGDEIGLGEARLEYRVAATEAASSEPEGDGELELEMPDELLPDRRRDGLTDSGEDPFAEDQPAPKATATKGAIAATAPPRQSAESRPQTKGGVGSLYRPSARTQPGSANVLRQDLDQRSPLARWTAIAFAILVALGVGYGVMQIMGVGGVSDEAPPEDQPKGPNQPLRAPPR